MQLESRDVFVTGSTGYMGRALCGALVERGHRVRATARAGSLGRVVPGCERVAGDALARRSFADHAHTRDTVLHLVGTPHPSPARAREFRDVDLASVREEGGAAVTARAGASCT